MRARRQLAALLVATAAPLGWLPAAALAAGSTSVALPGGTSPFSPGVPYTPPATTTATSPSVVNVTTTSSASGGISGTDAILIAIGAVVVLSAIAYFIWADSKRHARVRTATAGVGGDRRSGSKTPPRSRKLSPAERRRRKRGRAR